MIICIDWGTTNLRGWVVDDAGTVFRRHTSSMGLLTAKEQGFVKVYDQVAEELESPAGTPTLVFGMAGSQIGWVEVPYVATPACPKAIGEHSAVVPERPEVRILGGVQFNSPHGPEVMRGEEVQSLGIMRLHPEARSLCLPGTHTKWVEVNENTIQGFRTFITGELFDWLTTKSLIATQIDGKGFDPDGFAMGCDLALQHQALASSVFQLRTRFLAGQVNGRQVYSMASGLLIGHELSSLARDIVAPIYLCASPSVAEPYQFALQRFGLESVLIDPELAAMNGLQAIRPYMQ